MIASHYKRGDDKIYLHEPEVLVFPATILASIEQRR